MNYICAMNEKSLGKMNDTLAFLITACRYCAYQESIKPCNKNRSRGKKPCIKYILIEFQNQVNHEFMNRVIGYSFSAYRRYKVYPTVLIFAIKGFSSIEVEKEFVVADKKPFLEIESRFWTKKCFLVSSNSILEHVDESPMDSMVAMGYFLTSQFDSTVRFLFQLS